MKRRTRASIVCVVCGGKLLKIKSKFQGFLIDAYKCNKCKEEFFNPEQAEEILERNKVMHQIFKLTIGQIQSNLIIRIPVKVGEVLDLKKGEKIDLEIESLDEICLKIPK